MRVFFFFCLLLFWMPCSSSAATFGEVPVYYDEATKRYLTLEAGDFGKTRVIVRFAWDPGSMNQWTGQGSRQDKEMFFSNGE